MTVMQAFRIYQNEGNLVGQLLTRYADLEIFMMHCVQVVRGNDLDTVLRSMFGIRGESRRITTAKKLGQDHYQSLGLKTDFDDSIAAVDYCRIIRNQYAHCVWWNDGTGKLAFANLEEISKQEELIADLSNLTPRYIDVPLLNAQSQYFTYVETMLKWINWEGCFREGKMDQNPLQKPEILRQPDLNIPQQLIQQQGE